MGFLAPALYSVISPLPTRHRFCTAIHDDTNATTYALWNVDVGTPHATRTIIVAVASEDTAVTFTIDSVVLRGVSAAEQVESNNSGVGSTTTGIYSLAVPDGRWINRIGVTHSEAIGSCAIAVYALYDLASETASDTASSIVADPADLTIDVAERGIVIAVAANSDPALAGTWSELTQQYDLSSAEARYTGGAYQATDAETGRAISCDWSASTGSEAAVAAAFV